MIGANPEVAFQTACEVLDGLPKRRSVDSFYEFPETDSMENFQKWISASYRLEELARVNRYVQMWASDAAVGSGDLERGLAIYPPVPALQRRSARSNSILSMKLALGKPVSGRDLLGLFGARLTPFGRENFEPIAEYLTIKIESAQTMERRDYLSEWAEDCHEIPHGYTLFNGHGSYVACKPPRGLTFDLSAKAEKLALRLFREAENVWREEQGIPKIGEGWVSETRLFYQIREAFTDQDVLQHASPSWLGRQHLDVYIPAMRIGIEFQGLQHDQPVGFFGGQAAFEATKKRDLRKKLKCTRNGVKLVYVRPGYNLADVIEEIRVASST
jgi:hypothetical protein